MLHSKRRGAKTRRSSRGWDRPSARVRELIRRGAELVLHAPPEWLAEIDEATLAVEPVVAEDPVLAAATRRTNRANLLHWAAANVRDPGAPVPPNLGPEPLGIARDLVRRGVGASALRAYRVGQDAAWLRWMAIAFELTQDPAELRELLDVTSRSIATFVDATMTGIAAQMEAERDELTRGTQAERREVVALLLDGAPINPQSASRRLGYALDSTHRAAVVWSERGEKTDRSALEAVAESLARELGAPRPLTVVASAATLWVWVASDAEPDLDRLRAAVRKAGDVRVAIGSKGRGVEGFRHSHLDALTTQSMVARLGAEPHVVSFDMVRLVALVTQDLEAADDFVAHTLGDFASAPEELHRAMRTFFEEGCNASSAAVCLRTHRNTLLRRLARADELLPRPFAENRLDVAVALEVLRWRTRPG
jgi:DNA-binding PucR family transcriptional regulator